MVDVSNNAEVSNVDWVHFGDVAVPILDDSVEKHFGEDYKINN